MTHVSFIIAAHNAEPWIEAAVHSALAQQGVSLEILVVDDASTDRTMELVDVCSRRDERIRVIRQAPNGGPSAARNAGIALATGEWLSVLDADDLIEPQRSKHLLELATATEADIVADNLVRFDDATGFELSRALIGQSDERPILLNTNNYLRSNIPLSSGFQLGYLKPVIRSSFVSRHILRYDETVHIGEDFLFCLEALFRDAQYIVSGQSHYRYRVRRGSQSDRTSSDQLEQLANAFENLVERSRPGNAAGEAIVAYRRGLGRARTFAKVVDDLQRHAYASSLRTVASRPDIWPLIGRFGVEFALKRVNRLITLDQGSG